MERLNADEYLKSLPLGTDDEEYARGLRVAEAAAVRDMLPPVLRVGTRSELEKRVQIKDFLAVTLWTWGSANMLLLAPTGAGKTTACAILFRALLKHGVRHGGEAWERARFMAWYSAADLLEAAQQHPRGKGEAPETQRACRARLLILDDAGWDRDPSVVSLVLEERYRGGRPTIVSSGKTEDELVAHYGAAVVRRMTEPGGAIMSRFPTVAA
jgi:DNA replication protein DnaC